MRRMLRHQLAIGLELALTVLQELTTYVVATVGAAVLNRGNILGKQSKPPKASWHWAGEVNFKMDPSALSGRLQSQAGIAYTMAFRGVSGSPLCQSSSKIILNRICELLLSCFQRLELLVAALLVGMGLSGKLPVRSLQLCTGRSASRAVAPRCQATELCLFVRMRLPEDLVSAPAPIDEGKHSKRQKQRHWPPPSESLHGRPC